MISHNTDRRDFLFIVCASIAWGTVGIANQAIYAHVSTNALSLAFLRLAIAAPLFFLARWIFPDQRSLPIKCRDRAVMISMGGLQALYQSCYSAAIPYAGVTISTLVALCGAPVIVALVSALIIRKPLRPITLIALTSALGGTILLVVIPSHLMGKASVSLPGVLLAFLAACGYAGFILCGQFLTDRCHALQVNSIAFGTGALVLFLLALPTGLVVAYPARDWLILLYLGCVPTALAYGLFQAGMRSLSATVISLVTLFEPLTAAFLAWILFGEKLSSLGFLGAILLVGAMALILFVPLKNS